MPKSKEELANEYANLCAMLGEMQYKASVVKAELTRLNDEQNSIVQKLKNTTKAYNTASAPEIKTPEQLTADLGLTTEPTDGQSS